MQPDGWEKRSVGDVLSLMRNGFSCKQNKEGHGDPVTRIETISDGYIDFNKIGYAEIPSDQKEKYKLQSGDILFSHINSVQHIGKVAYFQSDQNLYHGMNLMLLRPNSAQFLPQFAFYFFSSQKTKRYFEHRCKKAINQASLNRKDIGGYEINLPPINEQRKIADVLQSVDEAITATQDVIDQTRKVKQGLLHRLLTRGIGHTSFKQTDIGEIPKSWEMVTISNIMEKIGSGWSPSCQEVPASNEQWGVLKTTAVVWDGYNEQQNKALPASLDPRSEIEVKQGDVLITRAGPIERVGVVVHVLNTRSKLMLSDKIIRLRTIPNKCCSAYLALYLSGQAAQSYILGRKTGMATSQTNISQKIVKDAPLALPPLQEQEKIVTSWNAINNDIRKNTDQLEQLKTLKAGVMSDLLSGRVRVPLDNTMKEEAA